jgi:hypothetical protein
MTYTDEQLKAALAKMLPRTVCYGSPHGADGLHWRPRWNAGSYRSISDTQLLHLCWLVEETLTEYKSEDYAELLRPIAGNYKLLYHATWQQRVIALAKVKEIEI